MSSIENEDDLRDALIDELAASLPQPVGEGEFTIYDWMHRRGVHRSLAQSQINTGIAQGIIERIPEKRLQNGHPAITYRKTTKPPA